MHQARLSLPIAKNTNTSADGIAIRLRADQAKTDASIARRLVVAKQIRGPVVGGHQNVEIAVAVKIPVGQPTSHFRFFESTANFGSDVSKFPITAIEKEMRRLRITDVAANVAHRFVNVAVSDCEIEGAVEIYIEESAAEFGFIRE